MSTILLLHGAYQGGWIWKLVAGRLRKAGHDVYTPTLDGCAERAHQLRPGITTETQADEIVQMMHFHDLKNVVIAGASSGGMVMARVAEAAPERISRVVFADALALFDGEKIIDIVKQPPAITTAVGRGPSREDAYGRLFAGLEEGLRNWAADRMTLHPVGCFNDPVKLPKFWSMPWKASVLYCNKAPNPGEAHIRRAADKLKATWHVLETGHYPMLSTPDQLTKIIAEG